ncbi:EAL domain-containing protein [Neptunicella marina]|uniref:EAL domain-containing protein n=1 Tax=Neptunicella marina TaxID=2125989 RepID=UPI0018884FF3
MLYENSYSGLAISLLASTVMVFAFDDSPYNIIKTGWWLVMLLVLLARLIDCLHWQKQIRHTDFDGDAYIKRFSIGSTFTALLWCGYCLYSLQYADTIELAFIIIIVSGMAGGAATILAAHRITSVIYCSLLLLPFSIGLMLSPVYHQFIIGVLGAAFAIAMFVATKKAAEFNQMAIRLKNENAILVSHMEDEVEARTKQINELSNIDPLSGLFNRKSFLAQLDNHVFSDSAIHSFALLFIDLDGFKQINDTLGHEVGDKVLKETASRLKAACKDSYFLCRWGGDEFLVGMDNADAREALTQARRLIDEVSSEYYIGDNKLNLGATIGIALSPYHATNPLKLIQLADTAMYFQKKTANGNAALFTDELGRQQARETYLKEALVHAIENNQIRLVYQPIIDSKTNQPESMEALMRWQLGNENISPAEFIPIAEQYGLIKQLGAWALHQGCEEARQWQIHASLALSVNASVKQLQDDDFMQIIDSALASSGLAPEKLHIEVTESVFAADKEKLVEKILAIKARNVQVSIDDFGTEYSSLSVIQQLAADTVKIDKTFVSSLATSGYPIVKAVVNIAQALDYKVVAEGVETKEQALKLAEMGVQYLQGFYFARPMETVQLDKYLREL